MESVKTQIWSTEDGGQKEINKPVRERIAEKVKASKTNVNFNKGLKGMALVGAGAVGMSTLEYFMDTNLVSEVVDVTNHTLASEIEMSSLVNDDMSFNEAFGTARNELGKGGYFVWKGSPYSTYYKEEWKELTPGDKADFLNEVEADFKENKELLASETPATVIYEEAPYFEITDDTLSFKDAFAMARQEAGPGAYFKWQGKNYSTYYKEEWNQMDQTEQEGFYGSIQEEEETSVEAANVEYDEFDVVVNPNQETFIVSHTHSQYGHTYSVGYFVNNGEIVVKLDVNMDGTFDYLVEDDSLLGLNGNDSFFFTDNPNIAFEQGTEILGYPSLVTYYENGDLKIEVDVIEDGYADTTIYMDSTGNAVIMDHTNTEVYRDRNFGDQENENHLEESYVEDLGEENQQSDDLDDFSNDDSDMI